MNSNFKKTVLAIVLMFPFAVIANGEHGHTHTPPVMTSQISAFSDGGAWAGGSPGVYTATESLSSVRGSLYSQSYGQNSGFDTTASFGNYAYSINGGTGPSNAWSATIGNAGITFIPPSMPHHEHGNW